MSKARNIADVLVSPDFTGTVTAAGLGIGTSTVTAGFKAEIIGDIRVADVVGDDAVEMGWSAGSGSGFVQAYDRGASAFRDLTLNNAMTLDSDGNAGLGVVPETEWTSAFEVLQIGQAGAVWANNNDNSTRLAMNVKYDGAYKRINANKAANLTLDSAGSFVFDVAATGAADSAISWTTGLEVLNDGRARAKNGLLFGTDTAAANALDDYEEGTWTPTIAQVGTFSVQSAIYTKVGNVVTVQAYLEMGVNTGSGSQAVIGGLPFTCKTNAYATGLVDMSASNTTVTNPHVRVGSGTTNAYVFKNNNNSLSGAEIDAAHFIFSVTYHAVS